MGEISPEDFLAERLKAHGLDIYASKRTFTSFAERLAHVLVVNRYGSLVCGRHQGRPETYEAFVLRVFDIKLKDVPRDTPHQNTQHSVAGT